MAVKNVEMLIERQGDIYTIWVDRGIVEQVGQVDGLYIYAEVDVGTGVRMIVGLDPRYDADSVFKDIEDLVGADNVAVKG